VCGLAAAQGCSKDSAQSSFWRRGFAMQATGLFLLATLTTAVASASTVPICEGTLTYCRPCTSSDDGQPTGCNGGTPICETSERNARFGYCVQCTSNAGCSSTAPICTSAGPETDTCRGCSSDSDCTNNLLGTTCLRPELVVTPRPHLRARAAPPLRLNRAASRRFSLFWPSSSVGPRLALCVD
jgi:hypothetical protein